MSTPGDELVKKIEEAKKQYQEYLDTQIGVALPKAKISIETSGENRTEVHMDVRYKDTNYHFEAFKPEDAEDFQAYLNNQPLVRGKYADGKTVSFQATEKRAAVFSDRFNPNNADLHLYSGFVVSDADTETFLGIAN